LLIILTLTGCGTRTEARERDEYVFYTQGVGIEVGEDADEVISRIGEPNRIASAPSCAGVGCDEVYIYNGFKISTYRYDGDAEIVSIELTNDTVATKEGIKVGSPESELCRIYGEGIEFYGGIEYLSDDSRLQFFLSDGRVRAIKYLKAEP